MIEPVDAPVSTADAKRIYREWMAALGGLSESDPLDRLSLSDSVRFFVDAMREHEAALKDGLTDAKGERETIYELKEELKDLRREIAKCTAQKKRAELQKEIWVAEYQLDRATKKIDGAKHALAVFKADKRHFLVGYFNTQIHGPDWELIERLP